MANDMILNWQFNSIQDEEKEWFPFLGFEFDNRWENIEGVYIIRSSDQIIDVGQGNIAKKIGFLRQYRINKTKLNCEKLTFVYAEIDPMFRDDIESCLADTYDLRENEFGFTYPETENMKINIPE
ncbi:MAG: hypothetical protein GY863_09755 [bacterium]|nr:hypothetical protein [bacterium]